MKRAGKILRIGLLVFVVLLAVAITFTIGWRPFIGPRKRDVTNRQFERTPGRRARGRYLVLGVLGCENCHSRKDWTKHGAPMLPGTEFAGQVLDGLIENFPGSPTVLTLRRTAKLAVARGPMTSMRAPSGKGSNTTEARFSP